MKASTSLCATLVALLLVAAGCSPDDRPPESSNQITSEPTSGTLESDDPSGSDGVDQATPRDAPAATSGDGANAASPSLDVSLPDEEPSVTGFEVLSAGAGERVSVGDVALVAWEMVAFGTGEVVESTSNDFGGPVPIVVGGGGVPAALDEAIVNQTIGTRLAVQFPAGMGDLPPYLDATQVYVLTVELVEKLGSQQAAPPDSSTPTSSAPATTVPVEELGLLVAAAGPLAATPPAGAPLPGRNTFDVVSLGDGRPVLEGDTVVIEYVMVSWTTGEVVQSATEDDGDPKTIVLGDLDVPRFLESALFRQPIGTRLQVIYEPGLPDLPDGLSSTDGYLLAVDIVRTG